MKNAKRGRLDEDSKPETENPDLPDVVPSSNETDADTLQEMTSPEAAAAQHFIATTEMTADSVLEIQHLTKPETPKHDMIILEMPGQEISAEVTQSTIQEVTDDPIPEMKNLIIPDVTQQEVEFEPRLKALQIPSKDEDDSPLPDVASSFVSQEMIVNRIEDVKSKVKLLKRSVSFFYC